MHDRNITYTVWWNLFLITAGSILFSIGAKGVVVHHNFITGGLFGAALLIYYATGLLTPGHWFLLFNLPIFIVSWVMVSRRFFLYSLYAMIVVTVSYELIDLDFGVKNQLHAAIAGGVICGGGSGLVLKSLGSGGGLDIVAIIMNQKYNLGIGRFYLIVNALLFSVTYAFLDIDLIIASLILVFISTAALEYVLSVFSQRKIVYVISDASREIAEDVWRRMKQGATMIKARGSYSGKDKEIMMTITNNIQLKNLEEIVFTRDPKALFIAENTFNVLGSTFSKRKIY